jgi:hypothetical protein
MSVNAAFLTLHDVGCQQRRGVVVALQLPGSEVPLDLEAEEVPEIDQAKRDVNV